MVSTQTDQTGGKFATGPESHSPYPTRATANDGIPDGTVRLTVSAQYRARLADYYIKRLRDGLSLKRFATEEGAAREFRDRFARFSGYLSLEFGAVIDSYDAGSGRSYFKLEGFVRSHNFGSDNMGWEAPVVIGDQTVAYVHTHPDLDFQDKSFSGGDLDFAITQQGWLDKGVNAYAFYPEGWGTRFDYGAYVQKGAPGYLTAYHDQAAYAKEFR